MERILVVDDEPDIVRMVSRFLSRRGYEVVTAYDGTEAAAQLAGQGFALIVTDISMPKMDGLALLREAKARDPHVEVVILTGAGVLAHAITALREGAFDYLLKPLERLEALGEVVQRCLERRRLRLENQRLLAEVTDANQRLEEKVAHRTAELEETNRRLADALRVKSEFLANMSHELRTPLNSILGFAELLGDQAFGSLSAKQGRFVVNIRNGGRHLLALVTDLLDLSAIEAGRISLHPEPLDLHEILESVLHDIRPQAEDKKLALNLDMAEPSRRLDADPVRIKQILYNLLSNAVKFTPDGGRITVTARAVLAGEQGSRGAEESSPLPLSPPAPQQFLELAVADTGVGIKAEDLPKLFQPLTQLESPHTKRHQGTGLGLALTKRLVEMHGGRIWAQSEGEGKGSAFTMVLPFVGSRE